MYNRNGGIVPKPIATKTSLAFNFPSSVIDFFSEISSMLSGRCKELRTLMAEGRPEEGVDEGGEINFNAPGDEDTPKENCD